MVDRNGSLVAYGAGVPPEYVKDSAAAEAWALLTAVSYCVETPRVITDCLSMIDIASGGVAQATAASAKNARIWGVIAHA